MAGRIQNLEIFAAGTWEPGSGGRVTITEANLDAMVDSFSVLKESNVVKPHLKLGHQDAQKWFGQHTGVPTLGWVERVWRVGAKLFADVANVPDALVDMIRQGRYHNVSIEVYPNVKYEGKTFSHVLSAIALLGTEMPAVKNLAGLASALFSEQPVAYSEGGDPITFSSIEPEKGMFTQEQVDSLIAAAVAKVTGEVKTEFSAQIEGLEAENKVLKQRAEGAEAQVSELTEKAAFAAAEKLVDEAIKAGKLLPKHKDKAMAFATLTGTVKFGGADKSPAVLFQEFIADLAPQVKTGEQGESDGKERTQFATAAQELDAKTREAITKAGGEAKLSYSDAMSQVLTADADLRARYSAAE